MILVSFHFRGPCLEYLRFGPKPRTFDEAADLKLAIITIKQKNKAHFKF